MSASTASDWLLAEATDRMTCMLCDYEIVFDTDSVVVDELDNQFEDADEDETADATASASTSSKTHASALDMVQKMADHLHTTHNILIVRPQLIADFPTYLQRWRDLLAESGEPTELLVLDGGSGDDQRIREELHQHFLETLIEMRQHESQQVLKECPYCTEQLNIGSLVDHLIQRHQFRLGTPHNMVHLADFVDTLHTTFDSLTCLYCKGDFQSHTQLRQHMRKKKHFRLDASDSAWDRFFITNYAQPGMSWQEYQSEDDDTDLVSDTEQENADEEWQEWAEVLDEQTQCLWCPTLCPSVAETHDHMRDAHTFDFEALQADLNLDFFGSIKAINYIRTQVAANHCVACDFAADSNQALLDHLADAQHFTPSSDYDDMQYMAPTLEDDTLLTDIPLTEADADDNAEHSSSSTS